MFKCLRIEFVVFLIFFHVFYLFLLLFYMFQIKTSINKSINYSLFTGAREQPTSAYVTKSVTSLLWLQREQMYSRHRTSKVAALYTTGLSGQVHISCSFFKPQSSFLDHWHLLKVHARTVSSAGGAYTKTQRLILSCSKSQVYLENLRELTNSQGTLKTENQISETKCLTKEMVYIKSDIAG